MSKSTLNHKGYTGSCDVSVEDDCLHGKILFIDDLITYEGQIPSELKTAFVEAVEHYLAHCKKTGKPANKPFSGTFNVRVGTELHRKAVEAAYKCGATLNEFVGRSLQAAVDHNGVAKVEHVHQHVITVAGNVIGESRVVTMQKPVEWEPINVSAIH